MSASFRILLSCGGAALLLSGCSLHAVNQNPAPGVRGTAAYSAAAAQTATLTDRWYESFQDPDLARLVDEALKNNLDIRQALARLAQADAVARRTGALRYPAVSAEAASRASAEDGDRQEGYSQAGLGLNWEIDAFNRLGAAAQADNFEKRARAADVEAVRLSLTADVAQAYYSAVAQNLQIGLLRQQSGLDDDYLDILEQRQKGGVGTSVDVLQQQSQQALTQSLIPPAEAALRVNENRLDVLLGQAPDAQDRVTKDNRFPNVKDLPPLGVPSDLLLNRPDLRALRYELVAADADIGAAIADRLPRITLDGSYLYADGPGAVANPVATVLGSLVQPLLDWGQRKAEVERNKALYEERLAAFSQAYLEAIEDVENALYRENRQREFVNRLERRRQLLANTLKATDEIYRQGISDYLPVLDAMQSLRAVERDLIGERLNLVLYRIQLFRALGAPVPSLANEVEGRKTKE